MLSLKEGEKAVRLARKSIENEFNLNEFNKNKIDQDLSDVFGEQRGVFVTLEIDEKLRGCIGRPYPNQTLRKGIIEAAKDAAFNDPRFPALNKDELDKITIEVTILTKPEKIESEPSERKQNVEIGKHGLIAVSGNKRGLLLPQVPVDNDWDSLDFLSQTAIKAGMSSDAWLDEEVEFYRFKGQIFTEKNPNGEVMERKINESN